AQRLDTGGVENSPARHEDVTLFLTDLDDLDLDVVADHPAVVVSDVEACLTRPEPGRHPSDVDLEPALTPPEDPSDYDPALVHPLPSAIVSSQPHALLLLRPELIADLVRELRAQRGETAVDVRFRRTGADAQHPRDHGLWEVGEKPQRDGVSLSCGERSQ